MIGKVAHVMPNVLAPIPWTHETSEFGSVWQWENPTFVVTVNGDMRSFYWTIADKSANPQGAPRPFADGTAASFEQAERSIRETIGKAYPPALGFRQYAGSLATTFVIGTGETIDLGTFEGRKVKVSVASREGEDEVYRGTAKVEHYELVLISGDEALRISPTYIMEIEPEGFGGPSMRPTTVSGTGNRTIQGRIEPGCNGTPGFMAGTVEHRGPICPIHEESNPQRPV